MLGVFAGSMEGANGIWTERRECSMLTGKGGVVGGIGGGEAQREEDCEANREPERGR